MKILFQLVTILLAIGFVTSRCARKYFVETDATAARTDAQIFMESNSQDLQNFIRYFLAEALRQESNRDDLTRAFDVQDDTAFGVPPEDFASNLLLWTKDSFGLNDDEVARIVEDGNVISSTSGLVSPHDIGCHCCPF